jgi:hypothetical protein
VNTQDDHIGTLRNKGREEKILMSQDGLTNQGSSSIIEINLVTTKVNSERSNQIGIGEEKILPTLNKEHMNRYYFHVKLQKKQAIVTISSFWIVVAKIIS